MAFDLSAPLADGRYVVSCRVVSADTHPVAGSFVFAVGTGIGALVSEFRTDLYAAELVVSPRRP